MHILDSLHKLTCKLFELCVSKYENLELNQVLTWGAFICFSHVISNNVAYKKLANVKF